MIGKFAMATALKLLILTVLLVGARVGASAGARVKLQQLQRRNNLQRSSHRPRSLPLIRRLRRKNRPRGVKSPRTSRTGITTWASARTLTAVLLRHL